MNMNDTDYREQARQKFVNHKATVVLDTDRFTSIDWQNENGSYEYFINYTLDKKYGYLFISGDLCELIAKFHSNTTIENVADKVSNNAEYFSDALCCPTTVKYYDADKMLELILKELDSASLIQKFIDLEKTQHGLSDRDDIETYLLEEINDNLSNNDTVFDDYGQFPTLSQIDPWYIEWFPYVVSKSLKVMPKIYYIVEGFYEALEQLKKGGN